MPWAPSQVEKLTKYTAKPTTSPCASSTATRQCTRGDGPNSAVRKDSSVATTASGSRSYDASSRTSARTTGTSSGVAARIKEEPQPCFVSQKILSISAILSSSFCASPGSTVPFEPVAPASFVASLNSWCSSGYFSKCGGLK